MSELARIKEFTVTDETGDWCVLWDRFSEGQAPYSKCIINWIQIEDED